MTCHKCKRNECVPGLKVCAECREMLRSNGMTNRRRKGYQQLKTGARTERRRVVTFDEPCTVSGPAGRFLATLNETSGW